MQITLMEHIGLNHQIFINELAPVGIIGKNSPNFRRGKKNVLGLFDGKKVGHRPLIDKIQFTMAAGDDICVTQSRESSDNGRAHQAAMAGHIDFGISLHGLLVKSVSVEAVPLDQFIPLSRDQIFADHLADQLIKGDTR